jgi:prefoldin subunit 5
MLADTEMVRCIRIFESVAARAQPQDKRAAIADARLTQERMLRSVREIGDQFEAFRRDWELNHMVPFTRMLADRQERMAKESLSYAGLGPEAADSRLRTGTARRQDRLAGLSSLAARAFAGLGGQGEAIGPFLAEAFAEAARAFETNGVQPAMAAASSFLKEGQWEPAAERQGAAAAGLGAICADLIRRQTEAARLALDSLREQAGKSPEAQKAIEALRAGSGERLVDLDPSQVVLGEILKMQKLADELKKRFELNQDDKQMGDYTWTEAMMGSLKGKPAENPDFSIMTLAKQPGGQKSFPQSSDLAGNKNLAQLVSDTYEDLAGDLLEEADDLRDQYETYNLNAGGQGIEQGDVGKQAGDLNSVSGAAATGNMKPPTHDFGGASRIGRQGARSHGMALGSESIDRRGRDEAQEGQDEAPDQAGVLRETPSDDPQKDSSTGVGGKEVQSAETPSFSTKDSGEWKDEYTDRLKAPRDEVKLVEHQGKALNPKIGELLRDLESTQEQVIERIKTLKKDLDKLYLPTEQFDDILDQLAANLDRLRQAPDDKEAFRSQMETLEKLKGAVVVFNRPSSDFQPSLPREQVLKNGILNEPAWPAPPGYEEAVKRYYESLSR